MNNPFVHKKTPVYFWGFLTYILCVSLASIQLPFFWDATYHGEIADWLLTYGMTDWDIPSQWDAGHPPLWSTIMALVWIVAGKSLVAVHSLMLLINISIAILYYRISTIFLSGSALLTALVLFCIDTTLLAQMSNMNADPAMLLLFLMGLHMILTGKDSFLWILLLLLSLLSIRGWFICFALLTTQFILHKNTKKTLLHGSITLLSILLWCCFHYQQKGWVFSSPAYSSDRVFSLSFMIRNAMIVLWRILDFGRVGIWVVIVPASIFYLYKHRTSISLTDPIYRQILLLFIVVCSISIAFLPVSNSIGHRYFLPVFALSYILFATLINTIESKKTKYFITFAAVGTLLSGSFWIYPDTIAKGWDSTIAYTLYPKLDKELRQELYSLHIPPGKVCAPFPFNIARKHSFLDQKENYSSYTSAEAKECSYFIYSNLSNDYSDEEIRDFRSNRYETVVEKEQLGIKLIVYKKN